MPILIQPTAGMQVISEMREFAQIPGAAQRYIRCSLDVCSMCLERLFENSRSETESESFDRQIELYSQLDSIRAAIPTEADSSAAPRFVNMATKIASFDLAQQKIRSFTTFRFLYERLLGAKARPWLLSIFVMSATTASISSTLRAELLNSIDELSTYHCHSKREPRFAPEWVDRLEG